MQLYTISSQIIRYISFCVARMTGVEIKNINECQENVFFSNPFKLYSSILFLLTLLSKIPKLYLSIQICILVKMDLGDGTANQIVK